MPSFLSLLLPSSLFFSGTVASNIKIGVVISKEGGWDAKGAEIAAKVINEDPSILFLDHNTTNSPPHKNNNNNITLDYQVYDDQASPWSSFQSACNIVRSGVHAIVGPTYSNVAIHLSQFCSAFHLPCISHSATAPELSDRSAHPYFGRLIPSDAWTAKAIVEVADRFGWSRLCLIHEESAYGIGGRDEITRVVRGKRNGRNSTSEDDEEGFEIVSIQGYSKDATDVDSVMAQVNKTKEAGCRIFVLYCLEAGCTAVLSAAKELRLTGDNNNYGWILADGCSNIGTHAGEELQRHMVGTICVLPSNQHTDPDVARHISAEKGDGDQMDIFAAYMYQAVVSAAGAVVKVPEAIDSPLDLSNDGAIRAYCAEPMSKNDTSRAFIAQDDDSRYWRHGEDVMKAFGVLNSNSQTSNADDASQSIANKYMGKYVYEPTSAAYDIYNWQMDDSSNTSLVKVGNVMLSSSNDGNQSSDGGVEINLDKCKMQWAHPSGPEQCQDPPSDVVKRTLKILTAMAIPPFTMWNEDGDCKKCQQSSSCPNHCYEGIVFEILNKVQKRLQNTSDSFNYTVHHRISRQYDKLSTEVLIEEDFDIFLADATSTSYRSSVVENSAPYFHTALGLIRVKREGRREVIRFWSFLSPFSTPVWYLIVAYFLAFTFAFWFLEHGFKGSEVPRYGGGFGISYHGRPGTHDTVTSTTPARGSGTRASNNSVTSHPRRQSLGAVRTEVLKVEKTGSIWTSFYWAATSLAQDSQVRASTPPGQLLFLGFALCNMLLIATYTANLAAYLVANQREPEVIGYNEIGSKLAPYDKVCLQNRGGAIENFYNESFIGRPGYTPCYNCEIPADRWSFPTALDALRNGSCKFIFGDADSLLRQVLTDEDCMLETSGDPFYSQHYTFMFQKNDPSRSIISTEIWKLREERFIDKLRNEYWGNGKCGDANQLDGRRSASTITLGFWDMAAIFFIGAFFLFAAFLCFIYYFEPFSKAENSEEGDEEERRKRLRWMNDLQFLAVGEDDNLYFFDAFQDMEQISSRRLLLAIPSQDNFYSASDLVKPGECA